MFGLLGSDNVMFILRFAPCFLRPEKLIWGNSLVLLLMHSLFFSIHKYMRLLLYWR